MISPNYQQYVQLNLCDVLNVSDDVYNKKIKNLKRILSYLNDSCQSSHHFERHKMDCNLTKYHLKMT